MGPFSHDFNNQININMGAYLMGNNILLKRKLKYNLNGETEIK